MATYQTTAIVLKRENIFEADRLYYLYTEDFGKIRVIAGGVRKNGAKLTGHLEPFGLIWVELMSKKGGDLFITTALSETNILNGSVFPNQIALFTKMSDFILKMLRGQEKDKAMWNFIIESFWAAKNLEAGSSAQAGSSDKFLNEFKSGFVKLMGFGADYEEAKYYLGDFDVL
ncbi:MAG: recombination protein O N-terminal domain-containing protein [Patescibacteria group bacterium]